MMSSKRLKAASIVALCSTLFGCDPWKTSGIPPIAQSALCTAVPFADMKEEIRRIRRSYVRKNDADGAAAQLAALAGQFNCGTNVTVMTVFSYGGPVWWGYFTPGASCLSASVIERRVDRPRFEHWVACDKPAALEYLIDFNNIETDNEPIDLGLRIAAMVTPRSRLAQYFSKTLDAQLTIADYSAFLDEGVMYTIDSTRGEQLELAVGIQR